ncbi:MAG: hypothetical protein AB1442_01145 [Nitrospirota bacterium]
MHKSHTAVQETIGSGNPGGKSLSLRKDANRIQLAGFNYPDNVAFTPGFFHRFLADSGALDAKKLEDAKSRVHKHSFSASEKEAIQEAVLMFPDRAKGFAIRSDDYPMGVGLWETWFTSASSDKTGKQLALRVGEKMKWVLASDFDSDVLAFKQKKGMTDNVGVLLMPLYGHTVTFDKKIFRLPGQVIHFMGTLKGQDFYYGSEGFTTGGEPFKNRLFIGYSDEFSTTVLNLRTGDNDYVKIPRRKMQESEDRNPETEKPLEDRISDLVRGAGPRYLELIKGDSSPSWTIVQSAPMKIPKLPKLVVPAKAKVVLSNEVIGTAVTSGSQIKFAILNRFDGSKQIQEIDGFNKKNTGYLLVLAVSQACEFSIPFKLSNFSNAAAVLVINEELRNTAQEHLGGRFREFGIPVLLVERDSVNIDWLESLHDKPLQNQKFVVYANEFGRKGFVALE